MIVFLPPFISTVSCLTRLLQVHLGHSTHSDDADRSYQALSWLCWKSSGEGCASLTSLTYTCIKCDDHIHNAFWGDYVVEQFSCNVLQDRKAHFIPNYLNLLITHIFYYYLIIVCLGFLHLYMTLTLQGLSHTNNEK